MDEMQAAISSGHVDEDNKPIDMQSHMQRVEMLCDLVTAMMKAMAQTPFAAMLPPDIMQQIRSLP